MIIIFLFLRKICERFICFVSKAKNTAGFQVDIFITKNNYKIVISMK